MTSTHKNSCSEVLIQNTQVVNSNTSSKLAWLKLISESSSTIDKFSNAGNFSIFNELDGGASNDYSQARIKNILSRYKFNFSNDQAFSILTASLDKEQINAWSSCMNRDSKGISLIAIENDSKYPIVRLIYKPAIGLQGVEAELSIVTTGVSEVQGGAEHLIGESQLNLVCTREEDENEKLSDISLTVTIKVNGSSYSESIYYPYYVPEHPPEPKPADRVGSWVYIDVRGGGRKILGHVSTNETGRVEALGKYSHWRKRRWVSADFGYLRIVLSKNGSMIGESTYKSGGIDIPPGCEVSAYLYDTIYKDNSTNVNDPLRVRLISTS